MGPDAVLRLLPFALVVGAFELWSRPRWLGVSAGDARVQVGFGVAAGAVLFAGAMAVQLALSRRRRALRVPAGPADLALQAAYYAVNAPLEEAVFRGLLQGGLGALALDRLPGAAGHLGALAALVAATAAYSLYHRLGGWAWPDVAATAVVGVPLAAAFWLLPGPPSLLGVAIAHAGATCGFLGPGPWLLNRLRVLSV